jgi:hypothetical protein
MALYSVDVLEAIDLLLYGVVSFSPYYHKTMADTQSLFDSIAKLPAKRSIVIAIRLVPESSSLG